MSSSSSSSSSSYATVTYTSVSSDNELPSWAEDQPLHASPIALSLGYIPDSKPIEDDFKKDREMDPVDYAAGEEEEEEEPSEDEDEEDERSI
nr:hypothetical protein [Tanacetum cinerariifolium]